MQEIYDAAIDVSQKSADVLAEIKDKIEQGATDMITVVYNAIGPQAFIFDTVGSARMGMALLAERIYENKAVKKANGILTNLAERRKLKSPVHDKEERVNRVPVYDKNGNLISDEESEKQKGKIYT